MTTLVKVWRYFFTTKCLSEWLVNVLSMMTASMETGSWSARRCRAARFRMILKELHELRNFSSSALASQTFSG